MGRKTAAITVDLHGPDHPEDIRAASEILAARGIPATFFVPTVMLANPGQRAEILEIPRFGHELASHGHVHDADEIRALIEGNAADLAFLPRSKAIHEDVLGASPTAFRSPCWCHLGARAVDTLVSLGYLADSSSTPQRLGFLSSTPFDDVWTLAPRRLTWLAPTLLEIPTSTFLIPAALPTFLILRERASRLLVGMLATEARVLSGRVLTLQLHPSLFSPTSKRTYREDGRLTLGAFLPRRVGGFAFKKWLRSSNSAKMAALTASILDSLASWRFATISEIAREQRQLHTA